MNFVIVAFSLLTSSIILTGSLVSHFEKYLPSLFIQAIRYGKFAYKDKTSKSKIILEVPKSWFKHFYWVGVSIFAFILYEATLVYIFNANVNELLKSFLNILCGSHRQSYAYKVYIALLLMFMQVCRRFYDTHVVSVFGKNIKINIAQYVVGLIHYPGSAFAIICEAPKFSNADKNVSSSLKWGDISHFDFLAIILFIWAWWHQHVTTKILANLRKNEKGKVVTDAHKLPQGDWFTVLSCPHQTAEILMYFSVTILLWNNITWFFVFTWVLSNQIVTILLSHWWYKSNFENFPNSRKAVIPFIY